MARKVLMPRGALTERPPTKKKVPVVLVTDDTGSVESLEQALTDFDVDHDLESIIPMPETIPTIIRATITNAIAERFEFSEDLEEWLHAPHDSFAGETPFERIIDGDGIAFLVALVQGSDADRMASLIKNLERLPPRLRLVR